jgi:hypothetical protein
VSRDVQRTARRGESFDTGRAGQAAPKKSIIEGSGECYASTITEAISRSFPVDQETDRKKPIDGNLATVAPTKAESERHETADSAEQLGTRIVMICLRLC